MIHVFDNLDRFSEHQYQKLFEQLPPSRKAKAAILDGDGRKIAISEYYLLKELLKLKDNVDLSYDEKGKPALAGYNFSFSHCDKVICIAVGDTPVGVDIEKLRSYDDGLARYVLNDDELAFVQAQHNKDEWFTKLWTQKEATIKCLGVNLDTPLKNVIDDNRFCYTFDKYKHYHICQCALKKQ